MFARSLCGTCVFGREIKNKRGSTFLKCESAQVPDKYPPQPVTRCLSYEKRNDPRM